MGTFENFLLNLTNFEKTRNVNHFKEYNLSNFEKLINYFNKIPNSNSTKISIVGTNGKGSVSTILSEILNENYSTGLYTSPHLISFTERIRLNSKEVSLDFLNKWINNLSEDEKNLLSNGSYFEILTLVAMIYFESNQVEFQIIEAGLGGRLDATRCFYSDFIVITKIDLDHVEILGDTLEKILIEKLGIITEKTKKIIYMKQDCITHDIIQNYINNNKYNNIEIYEFKEDIINYNNYIEYNYKYCIFILEIINEYYKLRKNKELLLKLENFQNIKISGRMEIINIEPFILYDVSHNPSGIENLLVSISKTYSGKKWDIILGVLGDKDLDDIIIKVINSSIIENIYLLQESPFSEVKIENKRIKKINSLEAEFFSNNKEGNYIVTGSFRLFPILKRILANYK
jgi:dihydrofolate synthase/folylpolyglutamate synthase